jgi:4-amino-4-deoxy-L-arabinose transferase-like glycosyltransferase
VIGRAPGRRRLAPRLVAVAVAVAAAVATRGVALQRLPPDYDETPYLQVAYWYAERMAPGRWHELPDDAHNPEHPALVKLLFAAELKRSGAPQPDWDAIKVGRPLPEAARPAYTGARAISLVAGVLQVLLTALVSPVAGLWLAFDTYHVKFTSEAMLEGVAGLFALLAVLAFERALRRREPDGLLPGAPGLAAGPLLLSAALLGLATASKYPYGLVVGLAMAPFLLWRGRARPGRQAAFGAEGLATFVAADPALWPDPAGRLWRSVAYHFDYTTGENVTTSALPWWQAFIWLSRSAPARWHPGVFAVSFLDLLILPAALLGLPAAARRRPVWAVLALVGLAFLVVWPTRWPQYTLLIRPALLICAGLGAAALWERVSSGSWNRD